MLKALKSLEIGGGRIEWQEKVTRLVIPPRKRGYANAQLDDYRQNTRRRLPWYPPLTLTLRARANSASPSGTLGFGFWNDPFSLSLGQGGASHRLPAAPQAAWFFYGSPPNDLSLGSEQAGQGWMAMSLRTPRISPLLLAPAALAAWTMALIPALRRPLFRQIKNIASVESQGLEVLLDRWHDYQLTWGGDAVEFQVDHETVLHSAITPCPPLGLVLWIDNQFLCASPATGLRFGTVPTDHEQWLELEHLSLS